MKVLWTLDLLFVVKYGKERIVICETSEVYTCG
ncbi:hypothetical protein BCQ_1086 [Bacillus cereus Q1]|uniref:Uncharacterized protein n=1 Tax=Bacillus cereus (strain Q1) TaxID=361100 RepID=B9ISF4_BACCQ|nr:hypothetical protein BCQ_1086 [Bacillus cereus Q1]